MMIGGREVSMGNFSTDAGEVEVMLSRLVVLADSL